MKKPALILLLMILCLLLYSCASNGLVIEGVSLGGYTYDDAERYTSGGASVSGRVNALEISWVAGSVSVAYHDGDEVRLSETARRSLKDDEALHWRLEDGKLYVKYAASGYRGTDNLDKRLTVLLPQGTKLDSAAIHAVSAEVQTDALAADQIALETVSGNAVIGVAAANQVTINAVSGEMHVNAVQVNALDASSVSGDVRICLPVNAGFTAEVESVSGDVSGSLPMQRDGENRYVGGDGSCRISVDTVSGDVRLDVSEE